VEKQELKDLNEKNSNSNFQEDEEKNDDVEEVNDNVEGINDDAEEINDDVEEMNDDAENKEEPETDEPKIPIKMVKNSNGKWFVKKTRLKKVKNFPCKICTNKSYTTRRSLQRHNNSFHVKKHSIKEAEVIPEVIYPKTTSPDKVKSVERKSLKRNRDNNDDLTIDQHFSKDEPVVKRPKAVVKRPKGVDSYNKKFIWESY
ncbi:MAG: DUF3449 domain-containing protein, partial [Gammaproteobacteria bacterium]|nr:DUF3449 domain-containing protein [Gammaproteobacteria bacterium]